MLKKVKAILVGSLVLPTMLVAGCDETHTHDLALVNAVAPTCETAGNTAYYTCDCGEYFSDEAAVHEIAEGSWVIEATGHDTTLVPAVEATCETAGNSAYYTCDDCGKHFSDEHAQNNILENSWIIPADGHTTTLVEAVAPTCEEDGNTAYYTCECGEYFSDAGAENAIAEGSWVVEALGHDTTLVPAVAPTCTTEGNSAYYTCECGEYFSDADAEHKIAEDSWVISANGHTDENTNGVCDVCRHGAKVQIGATDYSDLQSAIEAARNGDTLRLINDLVVERGIIVTKVLTLNLNGHNIVSASTLAETALIQVTGAGNLTIEGDGIVNSASHGNDYSMAVWARNGGQVTINGGTYTNLNARDFDTVLEEYNNNELIYASGEGSFITINDGAFFGNSNNREYKEKFTLNLFDDHAEAGIAHIVVRGGTYNNFNPADNLAEGEGTDFVPKGYKVVADVRTSGDIWYSVVECTTHTGDICEDCGAGAKLVMNNVEYANLQTAIDAAEEGATITLIDDVLVAETISVSKAITLELNGHNIIRDLTSERTQTILVLAGGNLTINGEGTINGAGAVTAIAIWAYGGKVTINGGTYINEGYNLLPEHDNHADLIYTANGGEIVINGGTFENITPQWTLNMHDRSAGGFSVRGGAFKLYDPSNTVTEPVDTGITSFVARGYKVVADGDYYTVVECTEHKGDICEYCGYGAIVSLNGVEYSSLQAAIDAAEAGTTITLIDDVLVAETISVSKAITLDLNGHNIIRDLTSERSQTILVLAGGDLTINGEGTINGAGAVTAIAIWAYGGKVTINGGTYINEGYNLLPEHDNHADLIYTANGGEIVINGGTFENITPQWTLNMHDRSAGGFSVRGGTFKLYDPSNTVTEPLDTGITSFVARGYKVVADGDYYTVLECTEHKGDICEYCGYGAIVSINGVEYSSLQAAIDAATDGDTLTLVDGVILSAGVTITKTLTLDLNGYNIFATDTVAETGLITVIGTGNLTINGNGIVNSASQGNDYSIAVWAKNGGKVTINGGTYTNVGAKEYDDVLKEYNNNELIYVSGEGSVITINGGIFIGNTENDGKDTTFTLNLFDDHADAGIAHIVVRGGSYKLFNPANNSAEGEGTNFVDEGYKSVQNGDYYTVVEDK